MAHNAPDRLHEATGHPGPEHVEHKVNYYAIFAALVGMTILTVAVAFVHMPSEWMKVGVALAIACFKAFLVATFFMHLKFEGKMIYLILIVPLCFTVILVSALIPDIVMPALQNLVIGRPKF